MKLSWTLLIVGSLLTVVACAVASSQSIRTRYHLNRMHSAYDLMIAESTPAQGSTARYEHHRNRLVELGYYFHATYEMENLRDSEEGVHATLWKLVTTHFRDNRHVELSYPDNVLEVWDVTSRRTDWDAFVKKHDVSEFTDRFIKDAKK